MGRRIPNLGRVQNHDEVRKVILVGDVRKKLLEIAPKSIQICVTSPPYWGLRDYGVPGQFGLEKTPQEYVENLVSVFRLVRELLADDGTLWLNLGSSYSRAAESNVPQTKKGGAPFYPEHSKVGSSGGAVGRGNRPGTRNGALGRRPRNAPACGTDGRGLRDSTVPDSASSDLCDGCLVASSMGNASISPLPASTASQPLQTSRDSEHSDSSPPSAECCHCANCGACLSVLRSSSRDARLCVRRASNMSGNAQLASAGRNQGKDASGMAWVNYTFKPKDMVPIPWMVAMALQQDGWFLRQDLIWSKPNPMPESVRDRCTKAHEYIFMLTKSAKYYYDAAAIAEPLTSVSVARMGRADKREKPGFAEAYHGNPPQRFTRENVNKQDGHGRRHAGFNARYFGSDKPYTGQSTKDYDGAGAQNASDTKRCIVDRILSGEITTRNKRSVWTVTTKPFKGAHFATFPPDLIEPCILAGSRSGDTVLDPFAGSGTTGMVAARHNRKYILIELKPEYAAMAEKRIADDLEKRSLS